MSEALRQRNIATGDPAGSASATTQEMMDKKAYKNVRAPESWKIAFKYGLPAVIGVLFVLAVSTGYYDTNTFKGLWSWFFRFIKAIFVWEDY
ncbi:hypothetical protein RvY_07643 [Ramazzottius varieornatus]|uniref:Uncharacterized protein n=1 Tax=Ramazzottius varieornatus TaxID=947166 RepID=A0A1D1V8Z5_RAMVA|nr:hypothetical protein RvY_07643 [Ramazzottius varieornatus]